MKDNLDKNLMLATALSPVVGYDRAAFIVKTARKEGLTLKQAALKLGFLTEEQFDKAIEKPRSRNKAKKTLKQLGYKFVDLL